MKNPTRKNRNIGTAKQGFGQNNKLVIPYPSAEMKSFVERLGEYTVVTRLINGHQFKFVIEKTRESSFHACTIDDIEKILLHIPKEDYRELELIILRQPTRKEENLASVWGRLIYSYEFENNFSPAVIIEAIDISKRFKWDKKLSIESQKELERLKKDGFEIEMGKRYYEAEYTIENTRATQLYRTLPHEFGHYVHYLNVVKRPLSALKEKVDALNEKVADDDTAMTNPLFNEWDKLDDTYNDEVEKLEDAYFSIPTSEKEVFAHAYADKLKSNLEKKGVIPFDRILDKEQLIKDKLKLRDFTN